MSVIRTNGNKPAVFTSHTKDFLNYMEIIGFTNEQVVLQTWPRIIKNINGFVNSKENPLLFCEILFTLLNATDKYSSAKDFVAFNELLLTKYDIDIFKINIKITPILNYLPYYCEISNLVNLYTDIYKCSPMWQDYSNFNNTRNIIKRGELVHNGIRTMIQAYLIDTEDLFPYLELAIHQGLYTHDYFYTDSFRQYGIRIIHLTRYLDIDYVERLDRLIAIMPTEIGSLSISLLKERLINLDKVLK